MRLTGEKRLTVGRGRRYLAHLGAAGLVRLLSVGLSLGLTPFVLNQLGPEAYGVYGLALSAIVWIGAADFGIGAGLNVRLARASARIEAAKLGRMTSSALAAQLLLATVVLAGGLLFARLLPGFIDLPAQLVAPSGRLVVWLAAGSALSIAAHPFAMTLLAHQLGAVEQICRGVRIVVRWTVMTALLLSGWGLEALGLAHLIAAVVSSALVVALAFRRIPELGLRWTDVRFSEITATARLGVWQSIGAAAGLLIAGTDRILAGKLVSLEAVAVLALSGALFVFAEGFLTQVVDSARPSLAQSLGAGLTEQAAVAYRRLMSAAVGLTLPACAALWSANGAFIGAWIGPGNYGGAYLDVLFAANLLLAMWALPHRAVLTAAASPRKASLIRLAEGVANLVLSITLGLIYGLPGIVGATALAACVSAWTLHRLASEKLGQTTASYRPLLTRFGVQLALLIPAAAAGRQIASQIGGFSGAGVAAGLVGVVGLGVFWALVADSETRLQVRSLLPQPTVGAWHAKPVLLNRQTPV